jgi:hypothetical protein
MHIPLESRTPSRSADAFSRTVPFSKARVARHVPGHPRIQLDPPSETERISAVAVQVFVTEPSKYRVS